MPRAQLIKAQIIRNYQNKQCSGDTPRSGMVRSPPRHCPPGQKCNAPWLGPLMVEGLWCVSTISLRCKRWAVLAGPPWVLWTISRGYRLQFAAVPLRFTGIIHSQTQGESASVLQEEILSLLNKGAICVIPPAQCQSSYFSR